MRFLPKLTDKTKSAAAGGGRTAKERGRRAKEIHGIDARTAGWLRAGGWASRQGR